MRSLGAYDLEAELGRGGMGVVYRARHRSTGAVRAVKVLAGDAPEEAFVRFAREAEALARAGSAGVVPVHETGRAEGCAWIAMDLLPGGSLGDRLRERGRYSWREAAALIATLARTLERCHAVGIVHRDVKPGNVLFDDQGNARLADFGLARDERDRGLTVSGMVVGTPGYMAPEQVDANKSTPASDVFALGAMLYELVTGERPYGGKTPSEYVMKALREERRPACECADIPIELDDAIARALAPDRARRTPSAAALANELDAVLAGTARRPLDMRVVAALTLVSAVALVLVVRVAVRPHRSGDVAPVRTAVTTVVESSARDRALDLARTALRDRHVERARDALAPFPELAHKLDDALSGVAALGSELVDFMNHGKPPRGVEKARRGIEELDTALGAKVARRGAGVLLDPTARRILHSRFGAYEFSKDYLKVAELIPDLGPADPLDPVAAAAKIVTFEANEIATCDDHIKHDAFPPPLRDGLVHAARDAFETDALLGAMLMAVANVHAPRERSTPLAPCFDGAIEAEQRLLALGPQTDENPAVLARRALETLRYVHEAAGVDLVRYEKDPAARTAIWRRSREASLALIDVPGADWQELAVLELALGELAAAEEHIEKTAPEQHEVLAVDLLRRRGRNDAALTAARALVTKLDERARVHPKETYDFLVCALAEVALAAHALGHDDEARAALARMEGEGKIHWLVRDWDGAALRSALERR